MDLRLSGVMILKKASCLHEKGRFENTLKNMRFSLVLVFFTNKRPEWSECLNEPFFPVCSTVHFCSAFIQVTNHSNMPLLPICGKN